MILLPRSRITQPQGRVAITNEWMDTDLGVCVLPTQGPQNLVTQAHGVGGTAPRASVAGVSSQILVAANASDVPVQFRNPTRACTWMAFAQFSGTAASWLGIAAAKRGNNKLWALMREANQVPYIELSLFDGALYNNTTLSLDPEFGSITSATPHLLGFSIDATAGAGTNQTVLRTYNQGVATARNTTVSVAGNFALDAAGSFFRAGGNHDGNYGAPTAAPWPHALWLSLYWPRTALHADAARALQSNPWQIFRADPVRIYSLPSGPITFAAPENLAGVPAGNSISWSWTAVATATGYEIETGPVGGPHTSADVGNSLSYEQTGLTGSTPYEARVRAYR